VAQVAVPERELWTRLLTEAVGERAAQPRRICELCTRLLQISGAGIALLSDAGHRAVVCATDEGSTRIEELQFTLGEGPCVDAVRTGAPVLVPDLGEPDDLDVDRWPGFMEGAGAAGVRAVFAFPLRIGAINVGALDLYRNRPGALTAAQLSGALMAADAGALALLDLDAGTEGAFRDDVDSGASYLLQVHQATGMVQVQLDVPTEQAFLILRAHAFATGRPVLEVAVDVVQRRLRFPPEEQ